MAIQFVMPSFVSEAGERPVMPSRTRLGDDGVYRWGANPSSTPGRRGKRPVYGCLDDNISVCLKEHLTYRIALSSARPFPTRMSWENLVLGSMLIAVAKSEARQS